MNKVANASKANETKTYETNNNERSEFARVNAVNVANNNERSEFAGASFARESVNGAKEYLQYTNIDDIKHIESIPKITWTGENIYKQPSSYQNIVINFLNPNTTNTRLLLKWNPGMGKTYPALKIAKLFLDVFKKQEKFIDAGGGKIFVIGFQKITFKKELLNNPDLGFMTRQEIEEHKAMYDKVLSTGDDSLAAAYKAKEDEYKKRFNKQIKFIGYKQLVNDLFINKIKSAEQNKQTIEMVSTMEEEKLLAAIKDGTIELNKEVLSKFENSFIICDEIQDVYNQREKNNWGTTLQIIFDSYPNIKILLLSATPVYGSPSECIDILNLLSTGVKYKKEDFFDIKTQKMLPGVEEKLTNALRGHMSFVIDSNVEQFAKESWAGEYIDGIPLFPFIRCEMSPLHKEVYLKEYKNALSVDSAYLNDFIIPYVVEDEKSKGSSRSKHVGSRYGSDSKGLYTTSDVKQYLSSIDDSIYRKIGLRMNKQDGIIYGFGLQRDKLKNISTKYYKMLECLDDYLKIDMWDGVVKSSGKIFIYHNNVIMSGVSFIKNILLENGFIQYGQVPLATTRCSICGKLKNDPIHKVGSSSDNGIGDAVGSSRITSNMLKNVLVDSKLMNEFYEFKMYKPTVGKYLSGNGYVVETNGKQFYNPAFSDEKSGSALFDLIDGSPIYISKVGNYKSILKDLIKKYGYKKSADNLEFTIYKHTDSKNVDKPNNTVDSPHLYYPATFITVMRDTNLDQDAMSIEKSLLIFNASNNVDGKICKILVSSRLMKTGHSIFDVRAVFVMSIPKNVSELIQIISRGRRKNGHVRLPQEKRTIKYYLFTNTVKNGQSELLSHEEETYKKKVEIYEEIQKIDKLFNIAAIDSYFNRNFVQKILSKEEHSIDPKWFEHPEYELKDIEETTFDIYHTDNQVHHIMYIIKRIFIEYFSIFTFDELYELVKTSKYLNINPTYISEETFAIALSMLLVTNSESSDRASGDRATAHSIEVLSTEDVLGYIPFDYLVDHSEKRLVWPDNKKIGYIVEHNGYYLVGIYDKKRNKIISDVNVLMKSYVKQVKKTISLKNTIKNFKLGSNYEAYKFNYQRIVSQIRDFDTFAKSAITFNYIFHEKFLEELVQVMFHLFTYPASIMNMDNIGFYINMYKYYIKYNVLITADKLPDVFKNFVSQNNISVDEYVATYMGGKKIAALGTSSVKDDLSDGKETSKSMIDPKFAYNEAKIIRTPGNVLPIGYLLNKISYIYNLNKLGFDLGTQYFSSKVDQKENKVIIGYYSQVPNSINYIFKIRKPIDVNISGDKRKFEKGIECFNLPKEKIVKFLNNLKLIEPESSNKQTYCKILENELCRLESDARNKGLDIKYVYYAWEFRPEEKLKISKSKTVSSNSMSRSIE
jgi:hypothetical protein